MGASPLPSTSYYYLLVSPFLPVGCWEVYLNFLTEGIMKQIMITKGKTLSSEFSVMGPNAKTKIGRNTGMMKLLPVVNGVGSTSKPVRPREGLVPCQSSPCPAPDDSQISGRGADIVQRLRKRTWRGLVGGNEEKLGWVLGPKHQAAMDGWRHQGPDASIPFTAEPHLCKPGKVLQRMEIFQRCRKW